MIHRDLKPENILLKEYSDFENLPDDILKIADFGLCKDMQVNLNFSLSTQCGTELYMAPELLKRNEYSYVEINLTQKLDTFAVALITYIMLTGDHPFASLNCDPNVSKFCKAMQDFSISNLRLKYADWKLDGLSE